MLSDDETTQLLNSLESRLEFVCNNINSHSAKCAKCKTRQTQESIEIMADSSTSISFTHTKSDLSEFEQINNDKLVAKTASNTILKIKGVGAMMLTHRVTHKGKSRSITTRLYPVYLLPGLSHQLLSVGQLLNDGLELRGSSQMLSFSAKTCTNIRQPWLQCKPHSPGQNIYWLSARLTSKHAMLALSLVHTIDYDIMHRRFAHPSKDVLQHASGNTQDFPSNLPFPAIDPVCPGYAEGKMTRSLFPPSPGRSKAPFDKIHMDPKEFSVLSYNKYKFFILFFDNCTMDGSPS